MKTSCKTLFSLLSFLVFSPTYAANVPGGPIGDLQQLVDQLEVRVTELEETPQGTVNKIVISGSVDLNADGQVVRTVTRSDGNTDISHFLAFNINGLTMSDPPTVTLYRRKRTDNINAPLEAYEFVMARFANEHPSNVTQLVFDEGIILLQYRRDRFDEFSNLVSQRYGLDGPGGTGDFRLVIID